MFYRVLGSLFTRRFSPRRIPRSQVESMLGIGIQKAPGSAAGRPARSLHTLRGLTVGDGAYGAAATAAIAGLVATLYFNKYAEESAAEVTSKEATSEEASKEVTSEEASKEVTSEEATKEVTSEEARKEVPAVSYNSHNEAFKMVWEAVKRVPVKDEQAMKRRFDEWMREYGRTYRDEEEKAYRYELFKASVKFCDIINACSSKGDEIKPLTFADRTEEEVSSTFLPASLFEGEKDLEIRPRSRKNGT